MSKSLQTLNHDDVRRHDSTVHYIFYDDVRRHDSSKVVKLTEIIRRLLRWPRGSSFKTNVIVILPHFTKVSQSSFSVQLVTYSITQKH